MSISAISFMGKSDNTENQKKTKKQKDKTRSIDVKVLSDNNGRVVIKAKDDFLKIMFDNRNSGLNRQPKEDTFIQSNNEIPSNEEENSKIEQAQPQTATENEASVKSQAETEEEQEEKKFFRGMLQDLNKELTPKLARLIIAVCTVALSSIGIKVGTDKLDEMPDNKQVIYDSKTNNINDISETYNVDQDLLLYINDIDNNDDLTNARRLKIPSSFNYLDASAQAITKDLYKSKNEEDTKRLGEKLDCIEQKIAEQKELASMYTDGDFVYICINDFAKNANLAQKYNGSSISVDEIETLFDIKKGELKKYNTIDNMGYKLNEDNQKVYEKFPYPVVPSGTILKVKKDAIDTKNPNLEAYKKQNETTDTFKQNDNVENKNE